MLAKPGVHAKVDPGFCALKILLSVGAAGASFHNNGSAKSSLLEG